MCGVYILYAPFTLGITSSHGGDQSTAREALNAITSISCIGLNSGDGLWPSFVYAPIRSGADYPVCCYGLQLEGRYLVMSGGAGSGAPMGDWLLQVQEIEPS